MQLCSDAMLGAELERNILAFIELDVLSGRLGVQRFVRILYPGLSYLDDDEL